MVAKKVSKPKASFRREAHVNVIDQMLIRISIVWETLLRPRVVPTHAIPVLPAHAFVTQ